MDAQSLSVRIERLAHSVDLWNTGMLISLIIAAIGAVAVVVTTRMVIARTNELQSTQDQLIRIKEASLITDLKAKDLKIAEAAKAVQEAQVHVRRLEREAADARAAQQKVAIDLSKQQEKAAIAERALLELKSSLRNRTITPEQRMKVVDGLKGRPPGPVEIWWLSGEPDSYGLATAIQSIFVEAGWPKPIEKLAIGGLGEGIFVSIKDPNNVPQHAILIMDSFAAAGIQVIGQSKPEVRDGNVEIYIGQKPKAK